ncbi:MAG: PhzF family phenazine biosynthesis protein [Bacteroidales bacterium]|nr:PhzF family phenazine biosynthesis protein [Bacteroidales bacterium]MBN2818904.1 PhzF family phenazine biosynthesis protein [Bacteroidales bacterium]
MRSLKYYILDVFNTKKYSGNQLAVFTEAKGITGEEMQQIAREINFSETTFITGYDIQNKEIDVRIFTPGSEVPFAGHPTLGTASIANKVFFDSKAEQLTLNLKAGKIPVDIGDEILWMLQIQPIFDTGYSTTDIASVLNLETTDIDDKFPAQVVTTGLPFIIVPLKSLDALKKAHVDSKLTKAILNKSRVKEIMVFTNECYNSGDNIAARVFVQEMGIPEDAATGSANGCLVAYLLKNNYLNSNTFSISVAQGYEIGRPSRLYLKGNYFENNYTIRVGGTVDLVAEGTWY